MKSTSLGYYLFIFLFSCGLLGCQQNSTSSDTSHDASTETPANNTTRPVPDSLVGQIPVYDVFESIAPIFEQSSDTTYVINFWATWCKPCVAELPYFEQLTQNYNDQKVKVLLISLDFEKQLSTKLLPFVQERQLQSEVLSLADGKYNNWIDKVNPDWSGAIPATIIYKGDKRLFIGESFASYEELDASLKQIL